MRNRMQPSPERYRNEWKYLINEREKEFMVRRMEGLLHLDPHAKGGGYLIRSLYFDDCWDSAYAEKDAGVMNRKKYRVRIYNYQDGSIKLERKKKSGSYIYKEAASLTRDELERLLAGDYGFLLTHKSSLCREMYVECVSHMMRPRVIVDYDREPWILDAGTVRLTFDMNVRAAVGGYDIFDATLPTLPCLEEGKLVLEVKFTGFLPRPVQEILPRHAADFTAVSKYVLCRDRVRYMQGFDYWFDGIGGMGR